MRIDRDGTREVGKGRHDVYTPFAEEAKQWHDMANESRFDASSTKISPEQMARSNR